jgi:hypothetical protein
LAAQSIIDKAKNGQGEFSIVISHREELNNLIVGESPVDECENDQNYVDNNASKYSMPNPARPGELEGASDFGEIL